ncbi:hypothetical protein THRCLA_11329 [Thraustotheca clavata]|uniref:Phosphomethylpyrimidine kinase n=1 Tax=Thraustotheca clavata TaxID=74557 RepID=A0A1V9Y844_9STRA|nr:hypothetical protein THRCLA_11329 [Thraustotheca clavata]
MASSLSTRLWSSSSYESFLCLYHPFVIGLGTGTLPMASFQEFLKQDAFYLHGFLQAFAFAVTKASTPEDAMAIVQLMDGIKQELQMHHGFMESWGIPKDSIDAINAAPATREYVDFLLTTAKTTGFVSKILAAMVPCARLYAFLGQTLAANRQYVTEADNFNRYAKWIATYTSDAGASVMEELLDSIAKREGLDDSQLLPLYKKAMQLELNFFEAYFPIEGASEILRVTSYDWDENASMITLVGSKTASAETPSLLSSVLGNVSIALSTKDILSDEVAACTLLFQWSLNKATKPIQNSLKRIPRVMCIAGSDSGGGAGIQADLKACTALGVFSTSAITAITAMHGIHNIPIETLRDQINYVLDDIGADVIKTGMLASKEIVQTVVEAVKTRNIPMIVDPVMVSTSGHKLLEESAHQYIVSKLFPLALLITPNIPEASYLLDNRTISTIDDMKCAAADLHSLGKSHYVLVKGGHLETTTHVVDVLYDGETWECFESKRINTTNTHGTGCTLASAIAANYAKLPNMRSAVEEAIWYVHSILLSSQNVHLGQGVQGPMLHWTS